MSTAAVLSTYVPPAVAALIGAILGGYMQSRTTAYGVRYARLYERRADVIDHLYKLVIEAQKSVPQPYPTRTMTVTVDTRNLRNQARNLLSLIERISRYYTENALWFDHNRRTEEAVQQFLNECIAAVASSIEATHPEIKLWYEFIDQPPNLPPEAAVFYLQQRIDSIPDSPHPQQMPADSFPALHDKATEIVQSFRRVREALEEEFRTILYPPPWYNMPLRLLVWALAQRRDSTTTGPEPSRTDNP